MPLPVPVQQEVVRDLNTPIPKESDLLSLERGMLGSQNRKKESRMAVAKGQGKGKGHENRTKEGLRIEARTLGEENSSPVQPNLQRAGSGGGEKNLKRGAKIESLHFFWAGLPSCLEDVFSFACQIKLSCNLTVTLSYNTGLSITSNFCCGKTEQRKLHTPLTSRLSW